MFKQAHEEMTLRYQPLTLDNISAAFEWKDKRFAELTQGKEPRK